MKMIDYNKLKNLISQENYINKYHFKEKLTNKGLLNLTSYSVGTTSTSNTKNIYEIRLDRYLNGEISNQHDGLQTFIKNIQNYGEKEIKIHSFDSNRSNMTYTIFTDSKVKSIIGIIESNKP